MKILALAALAGVALALSACDVHQTKEGKLPDVEVKGGQMPKYDVDAPKVKVSSETKTVDVPDVDVSTKKKSVEVPTVDVDKP